MNAKNSLFGLFMGIVLLITGQFVFAGGSRESFLPVITISGEETIYISPAASLGERDEIELAYSVAPAKRRRITHISHVVNDIDGNIIWNEEFPIQSPSREPIESAFTWDGKNNSRSFVDDGTYLVEIQARDNRDNQASSRIIQVHVDNTPPESEARFPYRVFSPNGDGEKDLFIIEQDGSREAEWLGRIKDKSGRVVKEVEWLQSVPGDFTWDGTDSGGTRLPDGEYSYSISSRDEAGNVFVQDYPNIYIDATDAEIRLQTDIPSFSPNNDGRKDTIQIQPSIQYRESILRWTFSIVDHKNNGVYLLEQNGTVEIPEMFVFDGKNDSGEMVPDGIYTGILEILYTNGNNPTAKTEPFILDTIPPSASVEIETKVFSPNDDGKKDTLTIMQTASREQTWRGEIVDVEGGMVLAYSWQGQPAGQITWNGRDENGKLVPDGQYTYRLSGVDDAGNQVQIATDPFKKSTFTIDDVRLSVSDVAFSPNSDGVKDTVTFNLEIAESGELEEFEFVILNESTTPVYLERGRQIARKSIEWNGTDSAGDRVAEGLYNARLTAFYNSGDQLSRTVGPVRVDVTKPNITVDIDYTVFSPDGDGNKDRIILLHESSEEDRWQGRIENSNEEPVFRYAWRGKTTHIFWDGTDEEGNTVPDSVYSYVVSSTDQAGNSASVTLSGITVDTGPGSINITSEASSFSPNNDGEQDTIEFNLYSAVEHNFHLLEVKILNARGEVVRSLPLPAGEVLPRSVEWDGLNDRGSAAEEGEYSALFSASYRNGKTSVGKLEPPFYLDLTAPEVSVSMTPQPFSPDDDGVDDTVEFSINATDETGIAGWTGTVLDPREMVFITKSGRGNPSGTIEWDGTAEDGEKVQAASDYSLEMSVRDTAGNTKTATRVIPVDVFITRENGQEKLMISSILFPARSDDFTAVSKQQLKINEEILDRIAEVLQRFKGYEITITGYAVSMLWADPIAAAEEQKNTLIPLSKSRAESVRDALIERGIEAERLATEGGGGLDPVVPHGAFEEHWKNRRVEFILERP